MNRTLIYIESEYLDLFEGTIVATTFKTLDIGDIKGRFVAHTNQIRIPVTPRNNTILQNANWVKSMTRVPYALIDVSRIVMNGIQIMYNAIGILKKSDRSYHLEVYEGTLSFFEAIRNKYVDDIDLGVYGPFDASFIDSFRTSVTPNGAPVIDCGRMFAPVQAISNQEFSSAVFEPWENVDPDSPYYLTGALQWGNSGGFIGVTLQTTNPDNQTQYLHGPYNFYAGLSYRVTVQLEVTSGTTNGSIQVELHNDGASTAESQTISTQAINTVGVHIFDGTFTANKNYDTVAIIVSQLIGGTNKTVRLLRIDILPQKEINVKPPYYIPTLNYLQVLVNLISEAGFTWNLGNITGNDNILLSNLNITFSKDKLRYNSRLTEKFNFSARADGSQVLTVNSTASQNINFTELDFNGSLEWYDGISQFLGQVIDWDIRIIVYVNIIVDITVNPGDTVRFALFNGALNITDSGGVAIGQSITSSGQYSIALETPLTTYGNSAIGCRLGVLRTNAVGGSSTVNVLSGRIFSFVDTTPVGRVHGSNLILPDMLQSDFFSDFLFRFGMLVSERNGIITTKPIQRVIEDRATSVDWTSKRDPSISESITYVNESYAQQNYFSDTPDDAEDAKGVLLVDNENAGDEKVIYRSPFMALEQVDVGGIKVCRVPIFDFDSNDPLNVSSNFETGVRLIYMRDDESTDPEVKYSDVTQTQYIVAVYGDRGTPVKSTWQHFIDTYYSALKTQLDSAKVVTRYYILNEIDIAGLDLLKLVFDDGAYYLINSVENFIPGQSTKVELFKVS